MNGLRKCIYTQWNFTELQSRIKFCHSQVNGWNWRTSSLAELADSEGQKSYVLPRMWIIDLKQMQ
jgi:hypothetical protein